jgi:hypothetical protein
MAGIICARERTWYKVVKNFKIIVKKIERVYNRMRTYVRNSVEKNKIEYKFIYLIMVIRGGMEFACNK